MIKLVPIASELLIAKPNPIHLSRVKLGMYDVAPPPAPAGEFDACAGGEGGACPTCCVSRRFSNITPVPSERGSTTFLPAAAAAGGAAHGSRLIAAPASPIRPLLNECRRLPSDSSAVASCDALAIRRCRFCPPSVASAEAETAAMDRASARSTKAHSRMLEAAGRVIVFGYGRLALCARLMLCMCRLAREGGTSFPSLLLLRSLRCSSQVRVCAVMLKRMECCVVMRWSD